MPKQYRLEDDLLRKNRPKWNSKRYHRLQAALHAYQMNQYAKGIMPTFNRCERCGVMLLNPQSILLHHHLAVKISFQFIFMAPDFGKIIYI